MSQVREYDFEIVVFKFENCFFTTKALFYKLQETVRLGLCVLRSIESDNIEHKGY